MNRIKILSNNGEVTMYGCGNMFLFDLSYRGIDLYSSIGESREIIGVDENGH